MEIEDYLEVPLEKWVSAIALRISDEWEGNKPDNYEDVELLRSVIEKVFASNPEECIKLIGTTIIEESYFDKIC